MSDIEHPSESTRRVFLRDAAVLSTVGVGIGGSLLSATAQESEKPAKPGEAAPVRDDHAKELDLGVVPTATCLGAVVVKLKHATYVTFHAVQKGVDGTGVLEVRGLAHRRFRHKGDKDVAEHPLDLHGVAACRVVEVHKSTWATKHAAKTKAPDAGTKKPLRHVVVTFSGLAPDLGERGVHFECLCEEVTGKFYSLPFNDLLELLQKQDAES